MGLVEPWARVLSLIEANHSFKAKNWEKGENVVFAA